MERVTEILMQTYTIILPIFMGYIVWLLQNQKRAKDANSRGTMVILKRFLRDDHETYTKRGYVTEIERSEWSEMYQAYADLGGNGIGKTWNAEVIALPVRG